VAFAYFPTIARLVAIQYTSVTTTDNIIKMMVTMDPSHPYIIPPVLVTVALGNGFILTAMLMGGFLAELINRRLRQSSIYLFIMALLSFFGIIHSSSQSGDMYAPWTLTGPAQLVPYQFATAYAVLGLMLIALSFTKESKEPYPAGDEHSQSKDADPDYNECLVEKKAANG
jgi:AGZA family xanthine/uracil permease-like MFS transporter